MKTTQTVHAATEKAFTSLTKETVITATEALVTTFGKIVIVPLWTKVVNQRSNLMSNDGNTYAIGRYLDAQEAYENSLAVIMYCTPCDETISSEDWSNHIEGETCPNCSGELGETK
jgi:hypothetical protein|tara:strand:+ start:223 stop:570 length:348 start_codon:yes stop_codon:yes gene_type:complete